MQVVIGADHRGFKLKQELVSILAREGYEIIDVGANSHNKVDDYPIFAKNLASQLYKSGLDETQSLGILICGSGIGMSMAANLFPGVRAALVSTPKEAIQDRKEHDSNCLILEADAKSGGDYEQLVLAWLETKFTGGRHLRRVNQMRYQENLQTLPYPFGIQIVPAMMEQDEEKFSQNLAKFLQFYQFLPLINIDIAEESFVGSNTLSLDYTLQQLELQQKKFPKQLFSIHLMHDQPLSVLERLNNLENVFLVYIHAESGLSNIFDREWSFSLALVLNPETNPTKIEQYLKYVYAVQLMTVEPGGQGRRFIPEVLAKSKELKNLGFTGEIHIDGGVNSETISIIRKQAKVDVLNAGSALVQAKDPKAEYFHLLELAND